MFICRNEYLIHVTREEQIEQFAKHLINMRMTWPMLKH